MTLPQGWTTRQTRFMWALVDPEGRDRSFGLTKEIVEAAYELQPEVFKGETITLTVDKHVDL